jgi:hypothetical protein
MKQPHSKIYIPDSLFKQLGIEILDSENGFIECPGVHLHTKPDRISDCKVSCNSHGPWAHCFHTSCAHVVANLNHELAKYFRGKIIVDASGPHVKNSGAKHAESHRLRQEAQNAKPDILRDYKWPYKAIAADSPETITLTPRHQWLYVLNLFGNGDVVWVGRETYDTGHIRYQRRFRPVIEWMSSRLCPGMFVCPNTFKPGVHSRSDANVLARKFLVVESDTLDRDNVGAVFRWLEKTKGMRLRAVVDTAGKSLHGWFDYPQPELMEQLKIVLPELGCDPSLFRASQPCRLPGATRDGKYQTLIYITQ